MDFEARTQGEGERTTMEAEARAGRERQAPFRIAVEAPRMGMPDLGEFGQHLRNAQREVLLAFRSLLDEAIERLERSEREEARTRRTSEIRVE